MTSAPRERERENKPNANNGFGEVNINLHQNGNSERITGVLLSDKGTKLERKTNIASTLLARDYKGFGNQAMTGVVEIKVEKFDG